MQVDKNYYEVLKVKPEASEDDIVNLPAAVLEGLDPQAGDLDSDLASVRVAIRIGDLHRVGLVGAQDAQGAALECHVGGHHLASLKPFEKQAPCLSVVRPRRATATLVSP